MNLSVAAEVFALVRPFVISRGSRSEAAVVTVTIRDGGLAGRGECVPYPRYGESIDGTIAAIEGLRDFIESGGDRAALQDRIGAGAARNAIDCALWDLEAKRAGRPVAELIGFDAHARVPSGTTIGIGTPEAMAAEARTLAENPLIKVKVDADEPLARIRAVRDAAPDPVLIVDPNESWSVDQLVALQDELAALRVDLLEQPIPAGDSEALAGLPRRVPIAADEAVHVAADVPGLVGRYDCVNIKLDKAGGLTEALKLAEAAEAHGLTVMMGCMLSSSLSIVPAALVAQRARFTDLDGPYLFAADRPGGIGFDRGWIVPAAPGFWGDGVSG